MADPTFSARKRGAMTTTYNDMLHKSTVYKGIVDQVTNTTSDITLSSLAGPSKAAASELRRLIGLYKNQWKSWNTKINEEANDTAAEKQVMEDYFVIDANGNSNRPDDMEFTMEQLPSQLDEAVTAKSQEFLLAAQLRITQLQTAAATNTIVPQAPVANPPVGYNTQNGSSTFSSKPLPSFNGQAWQWPAFWSGFDTDINQNAILSNLQKFHHLHECITGDAKAAITGLQITSDNYAVAVKILKARFDNPMQSQVELVQQILSSNPRSTSPTDQLQFIYQVRPLIIQLETLEAHTDGATLQLLLLAKFDKDTQKKTIEHIDGKKVTTEVILDHIEKLLLREVTVGQTLSQINSNTQQSSPSHRTKPFFNDTRPPLSKHHQHEPLCVYCSSHPYSIDCTAVTSIEQRKKILMDQRLCFKCLRRGHTAFDCSLKCKLCNGYHHASICEGNGHGVAVSNRNTSSQNNRHNSRPQHHQEQAMLSTTTESRHHTVRLWTGSCIIRNKHSGMIQKVDFLLDSVAQPMMISASLAETLQLPVIDKQHVTIKGPLGVRIASKKFNVHEWQLKTTNGWTTFTGLGMDDPIVESAPCPPLSSTDKEFLEQNNISLTHSPSRSDNYRPKILLGSGDLMGLLCLQTVVSKLPSGLSVIATTLGNIVAGQQSDNNVALMSCVTTEPLGYHVSIVDEFEVKKKKKPRNMKEPPHHNKSSFNTPEDVLPPDKEPEVRKDHKISGHTDSPEKELIPSEQPKVKEIIKPPVKTVNSALHFDIVPNYIKYADLLNRGLRPSVAKHLHGTHHSDRPSIDRKQPEDLQETDSTDPTSSFAC